MIKIGQVTDTLGLSCLYNGSFQINCINLHVAVKHCFSQSLATQEHMQWLFLRFVGFAGIIL